MSDVSRMPKAMQKSSALAFLLVCATSGAAAADRPAIIDAAKAADRATLRALIQKKTDVNAPDGDGTTALHWASYRDDLESVELLIRAGANVNAANDLGATPLWNASLNAGAPLVKALLTSGADPNLALLLGETPLMVAARSGKPEVAELLLLKGADVNRRAARGQTALMWAVAQQHPEVVKVLLAHGADIRARSEVWNEMMAVPPHGLPLYNRVIPHGGDTALLFAARVGDLSSARLLVDAGANVSDADAWGVTATMMAAHAGFAEIVDLLLERGADPNAAKAGFTALHAAIMRRNVRMVTALLGRGADPNAPVQAWTPTRRSSKDYNFAPELVGATPYWLAARFNEPDAMRLLLKHGASPLFVHRVNYHSDDPVEPRSQATTAVMAAVGMGGGAAWVQPARSEREALMLETVTLATEQGVDVNATNTDGRTALDAARAAKFETVVKFLVDHGARAGTTKN
jgi:ankyrin repeat protein